MTLPSETNKDSIMNISNKLQLMLQKQLNLSNITSDYVERLGSGFCEKITESQDTVLTPYVHQAFALQNAKETEKRAGETHVYDLVNCPRKQAYRKQEPLSLSSREEMYFIRGKAIEYVLKQLLIKEFPDQFGDHPDVDYKGIKFGIDIYRKDLNIPIEVKSSVTPTPVLYNYGPSATYVDQLKSYIAITNHHLGILYYFLMAEKDMEHINGIKPEWIHIYVVTMTKKEREEWLYTLEQRKNGLELAMQMKDPKQAWGVYDDPRLNFQCRWCEYAKTDKCDLGLDSKLKQEATKRENYKEYRSKKK